MYYALPLGRCLNSYHRFVTQHNLNSIVALTRLNSLKYSKKAIFSKTKKYMKKYLPSLVPPAQLPWEAIEPISFLFSLLLQRTRASIATKTRKTAPKAMPTIAPTVSVMPDWNDGPLEDEGVCALDPEWLRLWDPLKGGGVYGGGGGAGPLLKELPLYLSYLWRQSYYIIQKETVWSLEGK